MRMCIKHGCSSYGSRLAYLVSGWYFDHPVGDSLLSHGLLMILGITFDHSISYESSGGGSDDCTNDSFGTYLFRVLGFWCPDAGDNDWGAGDNLIDNKRRRSS